MCNTSSSLLHMDFLGFDCALHQLLGHIPFLLTVTSIVHKSNSRRLNITLCLIPEVCFEDFRVVGVSVNWTYWTFRALTAGLAIFSSLSLRACLSSNNSSLYLGCLDRKMWRGLDNFQTSADPPCTYVKIRHTWFYSFLPHPHSKSSLQAVTNSLTLLASSSNVGGFATSSINLGPGQILLPLVATTNCSCNIFSCSTYYTIRSCNYSTWSIGTCQLIVYGGGSGVGRFEPILALLSDSYSELEISVGASRPFCLFHLTLSTDYLHCQLLP